MEHEMRPDCKDHFDRIDRRLEEGDRHFTQHDKDIATLSEDMKHLTKAIDNQTKAIWGACGTAIVLLIGFVFWYIQSK